MLSQLLSKLSQTISPTKSEQTSSELSQSSASLPAQSPELLNKPSLTTSMDWSLYPNFSEDEFKCRHCGKVQMNPVFIHRLQTLRNLYGKPMRITSGYRCPQHPVEAKKITPGVHSLGLAADIGVDGSDAYKLLQLAFDVGFTGIGVNQRGQARFIHIDCLDAPPRPNVWSY
jgi:zinc D-Ala-D-Ala carboxypeptidase